MLGIVLAQGTPTNPAPTVPITVEGVLLAVLAILGYVVAPKLASALTKFVDNRVENDRQERRIKMDALRESITQVKELFERLSEKDDTVKELAQSNLQLAGKVNEFASIVLETQRLQSENTQLKSQVNTLQDRALKLQTEIDTLQTKIREYELATFTDAKST